MHIATVSRVWLWKSEDVSSMSEKAKMAILMSMMPDDIQEIVNQQLISLHGSDAISFRRWIVHQSNPQHTP